MAVASTHAVTRRLLRGNSGSPFSSFAPAGSCPHAAASGSRWSSGRPGRPSRRHSSAAAFGITGDASSATMRSASRQSPSTPATASASPALLQRPRLRGPRCSALAARIRSQTAPNAAREVEPRHRRPTSPSNAAAAASTSGPFARVLGHDTAAVVHRHVQHAVREVAEVVREVGVVALHHRLVREVAVGTEALVGHEVVAEPVDAEVGDEIGRRDLVEPRLAHLLAADEQPAVREHALRRLEPGRHQHRGPVHGVEAQDVLADEVVVDRPPLREALARRRRSRPRCSS